MAAQYTIKTKWNGELLAEQDQVSFTLSVADKHVVVDVSAPLYNDPASPASPAGQPCDQLWDYEVFEVFFLNKDNQYLEVEVCPHGQHLVLLLKGRRMPFADKLELSFKASMNASAKRWTGQAVIPFEYFPQNATKMNAYAINGSDPNRVYKSLFPAVGDFTQPDFHRLEFFQELEDAQLRQALDAVQVSSFWQQAAQ